VFERYERAYTEEMRPLVQQMMNKRVVIRIDPVRVRSWDHRKLGLAPMTVAGSTAQYLTAQYLNGPVPVGRASCQSKPSASGPSWLSRFAESTSATRSTRRSRPGSTPALNDLEDDPGLGCGILSGGPKVFSAGVDLAVGPGDATPRGGGRRHHPAAPHEAG